MWFVIAVVVFVLLFAVPFDLAAMTISKSAKRLGLSNAPDDEDDKARLKWLQGRRDEVLRVIRKKYPSAQMSSAYRSDAVNAAVDGSPTSRHRYGLAFDVVVPGIKNYDEVALYLHENEGALFVKPKMAISEHHDPHLHVEYFDPLGKLEPKGTTGAKWMVEINPNRKKGEARKLAALA
jgi:hypothetical protein